MLISHKYRIIFVHVQKTGGDSLEKALRSVDPDAVDSPPIKWPRRLQKEVIQLASIPGTEGFWHGRAPLCEGKHLFARDVQDSLDSAVWRSYFKFAWVRNPFDRLVSWYHMIQQLNQDYRLWKYARSESSDFDSFVRNCTAVVYESPFERKSFCFNQIDYITDERGRTIVDFVGRFESLEEDFARLCELAGLPKLRLGKYNSSKHGNYRSYYTDETREVVCTRYQRDLEAFNYAF